MDLDPAALEVAPCPVGLRVPLRRRGGRPWMPLPDKLRHLDALDEAITLRLAPVEPRARVRSPRIWAAVVGLSAVAGVLLFTSLPGADVAEPGPTLAAVAAPTPAPRTDVVLASGRSDAFVLDPHDAAADEPVIVIDDDEPSVASRRDAARARARERVAQAEEALRRGDTLGASRQLQAVLKALPGYSPAAAALAEIHIARGRSRLAVKYARRAVRSAPHEADYQRLLGDAYALARRSKDARKAWRIAAAHGSTAAAARLAG